MSTRLYIEPEAEEELESAAERYEQAVPGLGQQFVAEMRRHPRQRPGYWVHHRPK